MALLASKPGPATVSRILPTHRADDRMVLRLPADVTVGYFTPGRIGITVPMVQPGLVEGGNDWVVTGHRRSLIHLANLVAAFTS